MRVYGDRMNGQRRDNGFTLIELLIVIIVLALLASIVAPFLDRARVMAKIVQSHSDLRSITLAMELYRQENSRRIPPTRFSCSSRTAYELPVELMPYLPAGRKNGMDIVRMPDPFTPDECYKYRAVGTAIMNESTIVENAAKLWIPDGFPYAQADTGRYYNNSNTSPIRYAVWSMGPDPTSPKFDIPGRLPLPSKYWLKSASGAGVIVHCEDANRQIYVSP